MDTLDIIATALAPWCTGEERDKPPVPGSTPCERDAKRALDVLEALEGAGLRLVQTDDVHEALNCIDGEHGGYPDGPARTWEGLVRLGQASGWVPEL